MKQEKDNKNKRKEHDVETPSPPQVMDPSKAPKDTDSDEQKNSGEQKIEKANRSSKTSKKMKDRSLSRNEEL
jgi:hypothetical protein